jgi:hypothetical protein
MDHPSSFLPTELARVFSALFVLLAPWIIRSRTWSDVGRKPAGHPTRSGLRLLVVLCLWRLSMGHPDEHCLPGCICPIPDRMDCIDQRFEKFDLQPSLPLPSSINFRGSVGPWEQLPCEPFREVKWMNLAETKFSCDQAREWSLSCALQVRESIY